MEINKNTIEASAVKKQKKSLLSVLNEKRKKIALSITTMLVMSAVTAVTAFAEGTGGAAGDNAENMFNEVIKFFATWIGRIGLVIGFVGAIMFGLAIKNDDADAKTRGLMTMASGFVVYAVTFALEKFGILNTGGMITLALLSM